MHIVQKQKGPPKRAFPNRNGERKLMRVRARARGCISAPHRRECRLTQINAEKSRADYLNVVAISLCPNMIGAAMTNGQSHKVHLSAEDRQCLRTLRAQKPARHAPKYTPTRGAMLADWVAETVGSWRFIIVQSVLLGVWIILNVLAFIKHWDPYPFILLNLVLSFQAAYAAPIIMMSQNRQAEIDRKHAEHDYQINVKAELEIELLHNKIDALREQEMLKLLNIIQRLSAHLAPELAASLAAEAAATQKT